MCRRCLRSFDDDTLLVPDYASSIACTEDGDDASLVEMLQTHNSQTMYCTPSIAQVSRLCVQLIIRFFTVFNLGDVATNMLLF